MQSRWTTSLEHLENRPMTFNDSRRTARGGTARMTSTLALAVGVLTFTGCAVVSVASTAVGVTAGAVGLAADAAVGTAKVAGKAAGAVVGTVIPGGSAAP